MERPAINPAVGPNTLQFSNRLLAPSEQDVYATAAMFRAIAIRQGHNTSNKNPIWAIQVPAQEYADLIQLGYINLRRST
jgi:hypothetical protein